MDLAKYKPQVKLSKNFTIDKNLPANEKAFQVFEKLKLARLYQDALFLVIGKFLKITRDEKLYKFWDFDNFEGFLACEEFSFSREKAYMCIRVFEFYSEKLKLSEQQIQKIGITKLSLMLPLIKDIKDEDAILKKIDDMEGMRYSDFVRQVKTERNIKGKPEVYWNEETEKFIVSFYEDTTTLRSLGKYEEKEDK